MTPMEARNIIADARKRDLMLRWDQLNPKSGKSQVRYEYYKSLRTFKDVKEAVASGKMYSGDLKNDVERGLCVFEEPNACEGKANDTSSQSNKRKNSELLSVKIDDGREESISEDMKSSKEKCYQSKPRTSPDVHRHSRVTRRSLKMQQLEDDMEELSNQEGRHFIDRRVRREIGKVIMRGTVIEYMRPDSPEEPEWWLVEYDDNDKEHILSLIHI